MKDDEREYRYEQTGDVFRLQSWHHGAGRMQHGYLDQRPEWVIRIIEVAAVAGAVNRAANPPPDLILWFRTDQHDNLTEFINVV